MNRKPTILCVTESTFLNSGYSKLGRELLKRIHKTNKYNVVEFGLWGNNNDPRARALPWGFIGNLPDDGNEEQHKIFNSNHLNHFGLWKFADACLAVKPDYVVVFNDPFQCNYIFDSPYYDYFNLIYKTTVDATPQNPDWIDYFQRTDTLLTYTKWGSEQLREQCHDTINLVGDAPMAADYDIFKPLDTKQVRKAFGLEEDIFLVGYFARNQIRKLFSDLMESFRVFLDKAPKQISSKSYLYFHTTFPDAQGWQFSDILTETGLSSKVLFTYICQECKYYFPDFFRGVRTNCKRCGKPLATPPNSQHFVGESELAHLYNLLDVYVAYSAAEGFCAPVIEAAACGIPTMVVNYSALEDFPKTIGAIPIKVANYWREQATGRYFAYPDGEDFVNKLTKLLTMPVLMRNKERFRLSKATRENYDWDKSASIWMNAIDNTPLKDPQTTWYSAPKIHNPASPEQIPPGLNLADFIRWCYQNVLGQPNKVYEYTGLKMLRDLNAGCSWQGGLAPVNHKTIYDSLLNMRNNINFHEQKRIQYIQAEQQRARQ